MAAGTLASLVHAIYFCGTLLSLAGVMAVLVATWMLFYSLIFEPLLKEKGHISLKSPDHTLHKESA